MLTTWWLTYLARAGLSPAGIIDLARPHILLAGKCRDTFISLKKTCRKLGASFWQYLIDRHGMGEQIIPPLQNIIAERATLFAPNY